MRGSEKRRILITGGAGFIGSNLGIAFKEKYPAYNVTAFDNLSRRGSQLNLPRLKKAGVHFCRGDIRNAEDFKRAGRFDTLLECSADPSVLAGQENPRAMIDTNFIGSLNCLEAALKFRAGFIFLSTSRIYPIGALSRLVFKKSKSRFVLRAAQKTPGVSAKGVAENFPLDGARSFYGSTKLASEIFIKEYAEFSGLKAVINRCGVVAGPWQMGKVDQGFVTLWVARHFWKQKLRYIGFGGSGCQVRDVLHVEDLFRLLDHQLHHLKGLSGETFNVGGGAGQSVSLTELTDLCRKITGHRIPVTKISGEREADIPIYITDNSRVSARTGWKPRFRVDETVESVYRWLSENKKQLEPIFQ